MTLAPHKAQWNREQATTVPRFLAAQLPPGSLVWDPCAGTGQAFHRTMAADARWVTFGTEIEPEWADWTPCTLARDTDGWPTARSFDVARTLAQHAGMGRACGTHTADSTRPPDRLRHTFDGVVASIAFDNRFNDRYLGLADLTPGVRRCKGCGGSGRIDTDQCPTCSGAGVVERPPRIIQVRTPTGVVTRPNRMNYAAMLGRAPHPRSAAGARGEGWRTLTVGLLDAMIHMVRPGGTIAIEVKDATEVDGRIRSVDWVLRSALTGRPVAVDVIHALPVPGNRNGANRDGVLPYSQLVVLTRLDDPARTLWS